MHPSAPFHWKDDAELAAFVAHRSFGALFAVTPDGPRVAHVPVVMLDDARIAFHLARSNALTPHLDGCTALFVAQGPDGYISPDWYGLPDQVPTWNYIAVEAEGQVSRGDDAMLSQILDRLSAEHEARLAPKPVWTRDKMADGLAERMQRGIVAFSMTVTAWRGTRKLGQNKSEEVRMAAAEAVGAAGNAALASYMRRP